MVTIEPIGEQHLAFVQLHASHPSIGAASMVPYPYPADGAARWYDGVRARQADGLARVFAIQRHGQFSGVMSINGIAAESWSAELDYWVAFAFQGRGVATQAAALAMSFARESLGTRHLHSACLARNVASGRVLEKCGFREIGRITLPDGRFKGEEVRRFLCELSG
ncbi:GNAT family N-acetyltransferase [Solimonas terrae]|uniref:GNAT family N-acetyltransferase n=1 Tax=Solimonas terrae TaxID=1396819 RepID=A0A6M2BLE6_9GAMM|nr:GNAT family N-acetyltransferase [Solimonas terrae]NGY03170.1 GNAT family N-acetyltransferase [Solimonas terrae]